MRTLGYALACLLITSVLHVRVAAFVTRGHGIVNWAANKSFKILKFKFKFPRARTFELLRARSRLYRSQILQVNTRWKALAEIYTMHRFGIESQKPGKPWGRKEPGPYNPGKTWSGEAPFRLKDCFGGTHVRSRESAS